MPSEEAPHIPNPCPKKWETMAGDEKRRFCEDCQLHVHNLSTMNARERRRVLTQAVEPVCIAYKVDPYGRMVVPAKAFSGLLARMRLAAAGAVASIVSLALSSCASRSSAREAGTAPPLPTYGPEHEGGTRHSITSPSPTPVPDGRDPESRAADRLPTPPASPMRSAFPPGTMVNGGFIPTKVARK